MWRRLQLTSTGECWLGKSIIITGEEWGQYSCLFSKNHHNSLCLQVGEVSWLDSSQGCIILLSYLHFQRNLLSCKDQNQHSSEYKHAFHGIPWSIQKEESWMFREATEWSVLLQKTHVFMLPHTELVVFFANLNLKRGEQSRTRVRWHVISRSYRFLYFYHICCEFLWISIALWLFFLQGTTPMKDNAHFLTLFFPAAGLLFSSSKNNSVGREDGLGWGGRV